MAYYSFKDSAKALEIPKTKETLQTYRQKLVKNAKGVGYSEVSRVLR